MQKPIVKLIISPKFCKLMLRVTLGVNEHYFVLLLLQEARKECGNICLITVVN